MRKALTLKINPIPAPRLSRQGRFSDRAKRYYSYCNALRALANRETKGYILPASYSITFYMPMFKSWSQKKRRKMDGEPHPRRPDLDNLVKAVQDALTDEDDGYIWRVDARKIWSITGRIEIKEI